MTRWRVVAALLVLLAISACSSLPKVDRAAILSEAVAASTSTTLGRLALASAPSPDASGFRLMPLGSFSFDTRVQLVQRVEATLDVQYYHLANDASGRWLLRALRDAAGRGVRVRLLLDDLYTGGTDALLLGLAAYPNVEVRLFNPFTAARGQGQLGRFIAAPHEWGRINHRMHNKLFLADGAMAVIGGRNVADEYFLRRESDNFIDVDAFTVGGVLPALQALFDRYWNSDPVFPLEVIASSSLDPAQLRAQFDEMTGPEHTPPPPQPPPSDILGHAPIALELDRGHLNLIWGSAYVFADHPDKPFEEAGGELLETSVTYNVFEAIRMARHEVVASSPYLVPGVHGMELLSELRQRDVKVSVLTNSLASTDEPLVHLGYTRYRSAMLALGVDLYELSQRRVKDNMRMFLYGASLGRLHAKLFVIDGRTSYIGSMNLDPRSAAINTELGAVIDSPELALELLHIMEIDRQHNAYRVRLADDGNCCEWVVPDRDGAMVLTEEPDSSAWLRFLGWLVQPLVPEEQL